jgi:bifunctional DNA-binding transcriptional regulator/antitoxin component of YhaV-PrlF toxin-antitoxin module
MRATTRLLADGRITLPSIVRDEMELEHGDVVEVEVHRIEKENSKIQNDG